MYKLAILLALMIIAVSVAGIIYEILHQDWVGVCAGVFLLAFGILRGVDWRHRHAASLQGQG